MNRIRSLLFLAILVTGFIVVGSTGVVRALPISDGGGGPGADGGGGPGTFTIPNPLKANSIPELIDNIINFLILIAGPILTIMVLWSGFLFATSGGNPNQVIKAKNALLWAGIGFAIILISKGISLIIRQILGG